MTVRPVIESVVITNEDSANFDDFKKRSDTYSLTAPQTFQLGLLKKAYKDTENVKEPIPLLDAALAHTYLGNNIHIIKETTRILKLLLQKTITFLKQC